MEPTVVMEEPNAPAQGLDGFLQRLEKLTEAEEKIRYSMHVMREAITSAEGPNLKSFWEIRKLCLPLFKESLSHMVRAQLWGEYIELTREGRRLKSFLDEDSAFAVEQIDLAIAALKKEVALFYEDEEDALRRMGEVLLPESPSALKENTEYYYRIQQKLNALNIYSARINSLRKELIRTEMRIRQKNQFFQELSALGDRVFPVRKEAIQEVSRIFVEDVEQFVERYFSDQNFSAERVQRSLFFFRDEIKTLQAFAKVLTLNTHAFSTVRTQLSSCWDKLKGMEKEVKKEYAEHSQKSTENTKGVLERIEVLRGEYTSGALTAEAGMQEADKISQEMRAMSLTRAHVLSLKEELGKARELFQAEIEKGEQERRAQQALVEQERRAQVEECKKKIESLSEEVATRPVEALLGEWEALRLSLQTLSAPKGERQQIERRLKAVRDQIVEKEEQVLLNLSDNDREALENLRNVLAQRKERRVEIKQQMEKYRKQSGESGFDFEKAMRIQELMNVEKERLAKLDEGIVDIEEKIRALGRKG